MATKQSMQNGQDHHQYKEDKYIGVVNSFMPWRIRSSCFEKGWVINSW